MLIAKEKQARCEWFCFDIVKRATIKYDPRVLLMSTHTGADDQHFSSRNQRSTARAVIRRRRDN